MKYSNIDGTDTYDVDPIHITFIGCRGCGKTSLLASMFQEMQNKRVSCVTATPTTMQMLSDSYVEMLKMLEACSMNATAVPTLEGTDTSTEFNFTGQAVRDATFRKKCFRYPFVFTDLPGSWYFQDADNKGDEVEAFLKRSTVCLLAIDAPPLMDGDYAHNEYNRPSVILNWFIKCIETLKEKSVRVIFVLTRCETFVQDGELKRQLFERVRQTYAPLINLLKSNGIDICGTWVETLGGVKFLNFKRVEEGRKVPVFKRMGDYSPRNCEIPLMLTLQKSAEVAKAALEKERSSFWGRVKDAIGLEHKELAAEGLLDILKELETGLSTAPDQAKFEL